MLILLHREDINAAKWELFSTAEH